MNTSNSYSNGVNEVKIEPQDCLQVIKVEPEEFQDPESRFPVDLSVVRDETYLHQVSCFARKSQDEDSSVLKLFHFLDTSLDIHHTKEEENYVVANVTADREACGDDPLCTLNHQEDYIADFRCNGLFICPVCKKEFSIDSQLIVHMLTHSGFRPFSCKTCGKKFTFRTALVDHKCGPAKVIEIFTCNDCNRSFNHKSSLIMHTKIHTEAKTHVCEICNKILSTKTVLARHKLTHSHKRAYKCNMCCKKFVCQDALNQHKKTHVGFRPFLCDICKKTFPTKHSLTVHMSVHTGLRPHRCNVCKKSFTSKSNLNAHNKNFHAGKVPKARKTKNVRNVPSLQKPR